MREVAESGSAAMAALEGRMRRLERRVAALAEAVEVLARVLEGGPMAEPENGGGATEAARRAREAAGQA